MAVYMGFVVDEGALGHVIFLSISGSPCQSSLLQFF